MMERKVSEAWLATEIMTGYVRTCRRGTGASASTVTALLAEEPLDGCSLFGFGTVWSDPINHDARCGIIRHRRAHLLEKGKCN
jgi:hypothetical protein